MSGVRVVCVVAGSVDRQLARQVSSGGVRSVSVAGLRCGVTAREDVWGCLPRW